MSLAQRVRDYRYSKGWGPDELASRAEISRTALYQIESGKTELPRAGTLRRIALALEVSIETLLGHVESGGISGQATLSPMSASRDVRNRNDWLPAEGGPLTIPSSRQTLVSTLSDGADARFAIEAHEVQAPVLIDEYLSPREHELTRKFQELLASPLGEGVATIVEESYRLLPLLRPKS
jgi:transcriptional regulator with XRE-family HTH domain